MSFPQEGREGSARGGAAIGAAERMSKSSEQGVTWAPRTSQQVKRASSVFTGHLSSVTVASKKRR